MIEVDGWTIDVVDGAWVVAQAEERHHCASLNLALQTLFDCLLREEFTGVVDLRNTVILVAEVYQSMTEKLAEQLVRRIDAATLLEKVPHVDA